MDNSALQKVIEQQVLTVAQVVEEKLDDEISKLDRLDEDDLEVLRERRLQQLKKMAAKKQHWVSLGHGEYQELMSEKEFFAAAKSSDRVVCHFYRENWPCKVMDKHLALLASQHIETRFVKIHAEKSPFLTERLKIVVLPTLALVKNTKVEDYVVGFDELGRSDEFTTEELEERLAKSNMLTLDGEGSMQRAKAKKSSVRRGGVDAGSDSDD